MPRVPDGELSSRSRVNLPLPSEQHQPVATRPLPTVRLEARTSPDTFGASLGQAASDAAFAIVREEKARADETVLHEARRKLNDWEQSRIYDSKDGALHKRGRDALGLPEALAKDYDDYTSEIETGLGNDDQRTQFRKLAQLRREQVMQWTNRHVGQEIENFYEQQYTADIESTKERAMTSAADPTYPLAERSRLVTNEVKMQQARIIGRLRDRGAAEEVIAQELRGHESDTHARVVDRMLANNFDRDAQAYYAGVKDRMDPDVAVKIEKALHVGSVRGESQRQADAIVAAHRELGPAVEAARGIADPDVRDAVVTRVKDHFATQKAAQAERRHSIYLDAHKQIERTGGDLDRVPPGMLAELEPAQRASLEARSRQIRSGVEPVQNDKAWVEFLDLTPRALATMPAAELLATFRARLDNEHWDRAAAMWAAARDGKGTTDKLTPALSFKDRVDNGLRTAGVIDLNKTRAKFSDEEARLYARFETEAARALEHFELTTLGGKRKASGEEQQKVIDDLLVRKVFVQRAFRRDPERPVALLSEDERARAYVPLAKIPAAEVATMRSLINARGRRVTDDKLQRAYAAYLTNDRRAFDAILGE